MTFLFGSTVQCPPPPGKMNEWINERMANWLPLWLSDYQCLTLCIWSHLQSVHGCALTKIYRLCLRFPLNSSSKSWPHGDERLDLLEKEGGRGRLCWVIVSYGLLWVQSATSDTRWWGTQHHQCSFKAEQRQTLRAPGSRPGPYISTFVASHAWDIIVLGRAAAIKEGHRRTTGSPQAGGSHCAIPFALLVFASEWRTGETKDDGPHWRKTLWSATICDMCVSEEVRLRKVKMQLVENCPWWKRGGKFEKFLEKTPSNWEM